jgi:hypothetical protein
MILNEQTGHACGKQELLTTNAIIQSISPAAALARNSADEM